MLRRLLMSEIVKNPSQLTLIIQLRTHAEPLPSVDSGLDASQPAYSISWISVYTEHEEKLVFLSHLKKKIIDIFVYFGPC